MISDPGIAGAATVIGTVLSLLLIGHKSFWLDEGTSVALSRDWTTMWHQLLNRESNMWLYYLLLHFWLRLSDSEAFIRGLSALFTIATIPVLYALGRRLFGSRAGAISALLLAANPYMIRYAQEARGYSMVVCFVTLSSYLFVLAVERRSMRFWIAYGVCMALGFYTHFFAALVCGVQLLCLLALGRKNIPWRGAGIGIVAMALLLLPMILFQPFRNQVDWTSTPSLSRIIDVYRAFTGNRRLRLLHLLFGLWAILLPLPTPKSRTYPSARWRYLFVVAWAVLPVRITFVFSRAFKPMFVNRFLIVSLPAVVLLAASGIARLPTIALLGASHTMTLRRPWIQWAVVALMLLLSARCVHWWYAMGWKEDWRNVTFWVQSRAQPGDAVGFYWYAGRDTFEYYLGRTGADEPGMVLLDLAIESDRKDEPLYQLDTRLLEDLPMLHKRIWLVLRTGLDDPKIAPILHAVKADYNCIREKDFGGIHVMLFQKPYTWSPTSLFQKTRESDERNRYDSSTSPWGA